MLFNSWQFLFIFLPAVLLIGLGVFRGSPRIYFLVFASFVFYAVSGLLHAAVLLATIVWVYAFLDGSNKQISAWQVAWAIALPLGALFYFKYCGFFIRELLHPIGLTFVPIPTVQDITLPAGISFFTFHLMSYAFDRRRQIIVKPPNFPQFALFVSFFPHLIAGPILRFNDVADGLKRLPNWRLMTADVPKPVTYICSGLVFKVLIADRLSDAIRQLLKHIELMSRLDSVFVLLAYSFQIYFDFYGYSLIAIGLALLFGVTFPDNFRRPYSARNPREFWRRWHITLSFWIRDYVYLPLGGNRCYIRNILTTFTIFGLWHGAGWNYIIWGLYHGILVIGYHVLRPHWDRMPDILQMVLTFTLVSLGWLLFLFDLKTLQAFTVQFVAPAPIATGTSGLIDWAMVLVAAAVAYFTQVEKLAERACSTMGNSILWGIGIAMAMFGVVLFLDQTAVFIYFRF